VEAKHPAEKPAVFLARLVRAGAYFDAKTVAALAAIIADRRFLHWLPRVARVSGDGVARPERGADGGAETRAIVGEMAKEWPDARVQRFRGSV
jgi:hypothetical protein